MTPLERRIRLLLPVYPAEYRKDRGEEIIGTLLEATPKGRAWLLARDVRCLVIGGLRARAALNGRLTTTANLRIPVVTGAAAYLTYIAVNDMAFAALAPTRSGGAHQPDGPLLLVGVLILAAVALAWVSGRRAIELAAAIAAAAAMPLAGPLRSYGWWIPELACLAVLALLSGRREWPGWRWAWPVALIGAIPLLGWLLPGSSPTSLFVLVEALGAITLPWLVIDARPAIAAATFLLALWLPSGIANLVGYPDIGAAVPVLIVIAVAAVAVWQLGRQSGRATARRES